MRSYGGGVSYERGTPLPRAERHGDLNPVRDIGVNPLSRGGPVDIGAISRGGHGPVAAERRHLSHSFVGKHWSHFSVPRRARHVSRFSVLRARRHLSRSSVRRSLSHFYVPRRACRHRSHFSVLRHLSHSSTLTRDRSSVLFHWSR